MALITRQLTIDWGVTGLTGTLAVHVVDSNNADLIARTTAGITEFPAGSGEYGITVATWDTSWGAKVIWDDGAGNFASEWIQPDYTLAELAAAASGGGTGPVPITNDTGPDQNTVADFLTYENGQGVGIGGATVLIYLATDWPNNPANVQAQGTTQSDGSWGPLFVNHGTYVAVFTKTAVSGRDASGGPDASAPFTV